MEDCGSPLDGNNCDCLPRVLFLNIKISGASLNKILGIFRESKLFFFFKKKRVLGLNRLVVVAYFCGQQKEKCAKMNACRTSYIAVRNILHTN